MHRQQGPVIHRQGISLVGIDRCIQLLDQLPSRLVVMLPERFSHQPRQTLVVQSPTGFIADVRSTVGVAQQPLILAPCPDTTPSDSGRARLSPSRGSCA